MSTNLTPRLATSAKWTDLPAEFTQKVRTIFNQQFVAEAARGEFLVDGRIYPEEIIMRLGFVESGRIKQINFEASIDLPPRTEPSADSSAGQTQEERESQTMQKVYVLIDALGSVMEEYLDLEVDDQDDIDIPLRWKAYEFEDDTVYLQHSTINTRLEEEANRWLGLTEKALVQEERETEDALAKAEVDAELAEEIQRLIRSGQYPHAVTRDAEADEEM